MKPFTQEHGVVALLDRNNVDTDAILPKQFMKSIARKGFGQFAFDEWRYLNAGELGMDCSVRPLNPEFELNLPQYDGASILITRANFGCGSSREHAPWALLEYGFRVIIAESFAEIFRGNCLKNGILTITLPRSQIEHLFSIVQANKGCRIKVDLQHCLIFTKDGEKVSFEIAGNEREKLLNGWDDISSTLERKADILAYEAAREKQLPWLFGLN